jgi:hypothetical protein
MATMFIGLFKKKKKQTVFEFHLIEYTITAMVIFKMLMKEFMPWTGAKR